MKTILSNLRAVKSLSVGRGPKAHQLHREKPFGCWPKDLTVIREERRGKESHICPPLHQLTQKTGPVGLAWQSAWSVWCRLMQRAGASVQRAKGGVHSGGNPGRKQPVALAYLCILAGESGAPRDLCSGLTRNQEVKMYHTMTSCDLPCPFRFRWFNTYTERGLVKLVTQFKKSHVGCKVGILPIKSQGAIKIISKLVFKG